MARKRLEQKFRDGCEVRILDSLNIFLNVVVAWPPCMYVRSNTSTTEFKPWRLANALPANRFKPYKDFINPPKQGDYVFEYNKKVTTTTAVICFAV